MRKLIVSEFVSLDGVMEEPGWTFPYWNDEIAQFKGAETSAADALLLGRITYEGFAAAWPASKDEGAPYFNSVRKYVVSTTLDRAEWNNSHIIRGNLAEEIAKLKQQPGQNILVYGSGMLADSLMKENLVDQWNLLVYPVVLGNGKRLFKDGAAAKLKLADCRSFSTGVTALIYHPAGEGA